MAQSDLESRLHDLEVDGFTILHEAIDENFRLKILNRIREMKPCDDRRLQVTLHDGSTVIASRSGSQRPRELVD